MRTEIERFCAEIGSDPLLVQGAGGNISWKEGHILWVKASGTRLGDAESKDIFVAVDLAGMQRAISRHNFHHAPALLQDSSLKPSIETVLHALMPQTVVLHLHAVEALAHLVRKDWKSRLRQRLRHKISYIAVPYATPGGQLAQEVHRLIAGRDKPGALMLQNHGVVIAGDSLHEVETTLKELIGALQCVPAVHPSIVDPDPGIAEPLKPIMTTRLHVLGQVPALLKVVREAWALYPDHVVFLGGYPKEIALPLKRGSFDSLLESNPGPVFIEGEGVYSVKGITEAQIEQLTCFLEVALRQEDGAPLESLRRGEIEELLGWEAEKLRITMSKEK